MPEEIKENKIQVLREKYGSHPLWEDIEYTAKTLSKWGNIDPETTVNALVNAPIGYIPIAAVMADRLKTTNDIGERRVLARYIRKALVGRDGAGWVHLLAKVERQWNDIPKGKHIRPIIHKGEKYVLVPVRLAISKEETIHGRSTFDKDRTIVAKGSGNVGLPPWYEIRSPRTGIVEKRVGEMTPEDIMENVRAVQYFRKAYQELKKNDEALQYVDEKYGIRSAPTLEPITMAKIVQFLIPGSGRVILQKRIISDPTTEKRWGKHIFLYYSPQRKPGWRIEELNGELAKKILEMEGLSKSTFLKKFGATLGALLRTELKKDIALGDGASTVFSAHNVTPWGVVDWDTTTIPEIGTYNLETSLRKAQEKDVREAVSRVIDMARIIGKKPDKGLDEMYKVVFWGT